MTVRFEPLQPCPGPGDLDMGRCPDNALIDKGQLACCRNCTIKYRKRQEARRKATK